MRWSRALVLGALGSVMVAGLASPGAQARSSSAPASADRVVTVGVGESNCKPVTVVDGDGVLAVSADGASEDAARIVVRRWSPGQGWGPSRPLSDSLAMPLSCDLTVASDGRVAVVVWSGYLPDGSMVLQGAVRPARGGSWQRPATLMPSALDAVPGAPKAEPASSWAAVSRGHAVVAWNRWVGDDPTLGVIESAVWAAGAWRPSMPIVGGDPGDFVYMADLLTVPQGVVALARREPDGMATGALVSRLWTARAGWRPEAQLSAAADACFPQARQGGGRTVLLELCQSGGKGRLWVREWLGARWSSRVPVSPPQKDFVAYTFHAIAATDSAVAVAYQVGLADDVPWSVDVVRSTAPGRWKKSVAVVRSAEEFSRPVDFALRGADAVVVWVGHPADAKPGEVAYPVHARTLRADGKVSADVTLGDGVLGECHSATSGDNSAAFVWSTRCGSPFRIATWDGTGPWSRATLRPAAAGSFAVSAPWSVSILGRTQVMAWQADGRVVATAVPVSSPE